MPNDPTSKRIEANRENAKLGGVKSEEGKMKVRFNARKHGILSRIISDYEEDIYQQYLDQLFEEYEPVTSLEEILVERIALSYLRLFRSGKAENEYLRSRLEPSTLEKVGDGLSDDGYLPILKFGNIERLMGVYLRYETSIENRLYKALHELERIQRMRKGESVDAPVVIDMQHENGFVSQNDQ
ncbi:MAG: hypothetical protein WCG83_01210 [Candidatus Peregrinibacteria bacterium]